VLQRPYGPEPEEILRPGPHEAGLGFHSVVWFDPSLLLNSPETDAGINDDVLLCPTMSEPAEGVRQYEAWRAARNQRLVAGVAPEFRVRRITEPEACPRACQRARSG
jgi:hypothetical protein